MQARLPDSQPRRIAVILGTGGSGRSLLELLRPLLDEEEPVEMHGVFVEDDEVQLAAELPFVKELCRLTFSVREFHSDQFERAVTLRMRTARRAIDELASRAGILHSFRNVRGSAVRLLHETAWSADITVFEPLHMFLADQVQTVARGRTAHRRVVVAIDDPVSGRAALVAAAVLAEGQMHRISVLATGAATRNPEALQRAIDSLLPAPPARIRTVADSDVQALIEAARLEGPGMLVLGATDELLTPEALRLLREQLRCPVCLVRHWGAETE